MPTTRRCVSLRGSTYARLRQYADAHGLTCSGIVEELLAGLWARPPAPVPVMPARSRRVPHVPPEPSATRRPRPLAAAELAPRAGEGNVMLL